MIEFFRHESGQRRSCETRLAFEGRGFELVVEDASGTHVEQFFDLGRLLAREHQLQTAWRALGWRPDGHGWSLLRPVHPF
jgi:hypothetical protein